MSSSIKLLIGTCPKPFIEPFTLIQRNAIKSWKNMYHPNVDVDVVLFGNEKGVSENAKELNCKHIKDTQKNKFGTPLVDDIFSKMATEAEHLQKQYPKSEIVCCYINADIITFACMLENINDFVGAKQKNTFKQKNESHDDDTWLLIGSRWDVDDVP